MACSSNFLSIKDLDCSKKVSYYCRECFHPLLSIDQSACTYECSMNNQRRPFKNISELVICNVKQEIASIAKRYINIIHEYQNESKVALPGDVLNGQVSIAYLTLFAINSVKICYLLTHSNSSQT